MQDATEAADLSAELQVLYDQVPATRCAHSGECCVLTGEEYAGGYATMFPLYRAEYRNIVAYVKRHFSKKRQEELLNFTQERPDRCPFLGADHNCTIYPVRPLICRTYAVMNPQTIDREAERHQGQVPQDWIQGFVIRESGMVCPRVRVTEPDKLERHAHNLITSAYERVLNRLSRQVSLDSDERLHLFRQIARRRTLPLRWTWGGFNAVYRTPLEWLQNQFDKYWKKAELADAD